MYNNIFMSNECINELLKMIQIIKEYKELCSTNTRLRILFESQLNYEKKSFIQNFKIDFNGIPDDNIMKMHTLTLLKEMGITEDELK